MPIDPINRIPNFQVAESNEANEEERRRDKQKTGAKEKAKNPAFPKVATSATQEVLAQDSDTKNLQCQPIDTNKVVELLAHRPDKTPQAYSAKIKVISKIADVKKSPFSPIKNLNKSA